MINFEDRVTEINNLIKSSQGKEDKIILKLLFDMVCFEKPKINENEKISNLTDKELFNQFAPYNFNNSSKKELLPYFQEVYNRFSTSNNHDNRYQIKYNSTKDFNYYGLTSAYDSEIILNYTYVSQMKKKDFNFSLGADRRTISSFMLITLFHEAEHTFQFDKILDFVQNKDVSGKNAVFMLEMLVKKVIAENMIDGVIPENLKPLADKIRYSYSCSFLEHDANVTALTTAKNVIDSELLTNHHKNILESSLSKKAKIFLEYNIFNCMTTDLTNKIEGMQNVVCYYADFIEENLKDGKLKTKLLKEVKKYIKEDKKGNSKFKQDILEDYKTCISFADLTEKEIVF